jgi:hypothetical protein
MDSLHREIARAVAAGQVADGTLAKIIASRWPEANRLAVRGVSSSLSRNIAIPSWAAERSRAIESSAHDVRVASCVIDGMEQVDMKDVIMSASHLLDYVRSALTNRTRLDVRAGYVHAGMRRRLPGKDAIKISIKWSGPNGGIAPNSQVVVKMNGQSFAAFYSQTQSQLHLNRVGYHTPSWKFWLVWVMAAMRMAAYRPVPQAYWVHVWHNKSPAFERDVMEVVHRRFPQAKAHVL